MTLLHRSTAPTRTAAAVDRAVPVRDATDVADRAVRASRTAALVAVVVALALPSWLLAHQTWVLGAGFLLGLPHGAVDHLLPPRHGWVRRGPAGLLAVLLGYLGLAVLAWTGLRLAGPVVLPLLLALSVLHFGAADLEVSGSGTRTSWGRLSTWVGALGRGAPVVAGPLLCWPTSTGAALAVVGLGTPPGRTTAAVVAVVLLGTSALAVGSAVGQRRLADAAEIVLLVSLFTLAPPLAAFGVYFGAWHGLRHTARLLTDDPHDAEDLETGRLRRPLARFLREAALPTTVALATVLLLVHLTAGQAQLAGPVFAALLALTVPHVVVVALWDHTQHTVKPARATSGTRRTRATSSSRPGREVVAHVTSTRR